VSGGTDDGPDVVPGHRLTVGDLGVGPLVTAAGAALVDATRRRNEHSSAPDVRPIQPGAVVKILRTNSAAARKLHIFTYLFKHRRQRA